MPGGHVAPLRVLQVQGPPLEGLLAEAPRHYLVNSSGGCGGAAGCGAASPGPAVLPASASTRGGETPTRATCDARGAVVAVRFPRTGTSR